MPLNVSLSHVLSKTTSSLPSGSVRQAPLSSSACRGNRVKRARAAQLITVRIVILGKCMLAAGKRQEKTLDKIAL